MSRELLNRNSDLKRLRDEGYLVQIKGGLLLLRGVPYVNEAKQVRMGTLISTLTLAGDLTQLPDTHVVYFDGEPPCTADGVKIPIVHQSQDFNLGNEVVAKCSFSRKPEGGYKDYYEKMSTYAAILSAPAEQLKPGANPRTLVAYEEGDDDCIFKYAETASDRAGIGALAERLSHERVAIIGLGGTGAYILDLVSKTPVREIRLIDGDEFLTHNAFRTPGAPSLEELRDAPKKVEYLKAIYSKMHRAVVAHAVYVNADNLHLLDGVTFAFICIDGGGEKRLIIDCLETLGIPFIDVGMGLELVDESLGGILRVTASTPGKRDHIHSGKISFEAGGADDLYASNIQVADLNSLNAALAVVKWKKIRGFYRDLEREHHCTYTTDGNITINSEQNDEIPAP